MNKHIQKGKVLFQKLIKILVRFWVSIKFILLRQFNKNIYTRILFTNVLCFVICLTALITIFDFTVTQVTYNQLQQQSLRKVKRVNFALLEQGNLEWLVPTTGEDNKSLDNQQELLVFLADAFDAKISIFNKEGTIVSTSAKQEVVAGSQVDKKFIKIISTGETITTKIIDNETGDPVFIAAIPMGDSIDSIDTIKNGILLEIKPSNLDPTINKMRLYLIVGGMFILIIVIFISVYQAMFISKPISRLATSIAELDSGNYFIQGDDVPLDEVKILTVQLNKLTEKMQKIQEQNQKVEEERTQLFAEISHELRTPLTAVQGFVEAILDGIVEDKDLLDRYLEIIYTQTLHINRLIDDILQLSRLESETIILEKIPLDLVSIVQSIIMSMKPIAQAKNISILFEKNIEQAIIMGDIDRVEQVIRNLLKNAVNATEDGEITFKIEIPENEVILTIQDNGIGISNAELPLIWNRFYRSKKHRSNVKQQEGTGLGLVIVKQLVQLHNGTIEVESQLGNGTIFYVHFPSLKQV